MALPNVTPEQRAKALEKAAQVRKARKELTGNRPIIGRLVELINRPVCVVRRLETDEGEIVPVCSNCGEPIFLTDSFCPHCSAEVVGNEFDC